jgi:hypothetical protein
VTTQLSTTKLQFLNTTNGNNLPHNSNGTHQLHNTTNGNNLLNHNGTLLNHNGTHQPLNGTLPLHQHQLAETNTQQEFHLSLAPTTHTVTLTLELQDTKLFALTHFQDTLNVFTQLEFQQLNAPTIQNVN